MRTLGPVVLLLLGSCAYPVQAGAQARAPGELAFVLAFGDRAYVVVADAPEEAWAYGAPRLIEQGEIMAVAVRDVERAQLPLALEGALEERWAAYDPRGASCSGTLGPPVELRLADVTFIDPVAEPDEVERAVREAPFARYLAAPIEAACPIHASWAHPVSRAPHARFVLSSEPSNDEHGLVLDALRATPAYRDLQRDYEAFASEQERSEPDHEPLPRHWEEYDMGEVRVRQLREAGGQSALVLVSAHAGYGCGGFAARLWAIFERAPDGGLVPIGSGTDEVPYTLLDLDGDGALERLTYEALVDGDEVRSIQREPWICPC